MLYLVMEPFFSKLNVCSTQYVKQNRCLVAAGYMVVGNVSLAVWAFPFPRGITGSQGTGEHNLKSTGLV